MRIALHHAHPTPSVRLQLSASSRRLLLALGSAVAPYAVAALVVFAYHEQWFR
ncbi:MAG: hypothetical protein REI09_02415 [Candidatus Dactylopiibacterium sp.]|nr:hypothetical protein [Candidatus Dactylopiibacterium sp.]